MSMTKKYLSGDIILDEKANYYIVIYDDPKPGDPVFPGKVWDGKYPEGTVPCVRLTPSMKNPDRRYMSVRTRPGIIGQFKVWFLEESKVHLYRRIISEKTKNFIPVEKSHSFQTVDFGKYGINDKFIYPEVKVILEVGNKKNEFTLETYIRLKYRGKYYLCKCKKQSEVSDNLSEKVDIICEMKHFYAEVYKYQKLMKVDLKIIIPGNWEPPRRVFELDPDQTPEEERLQPDKR